MPGPGETEFFPIPMPKAIPPEQLIDVLNWRYATRKFDVARKIPAAEWQALEQALVLAPTRELAQQIEKVMRALGDYLQVRCAPLCVSLCVGCVWVLCVWVCGWACVWGGCF